MMSRFKRLLAVALAVGFVLASRNAAAADPAVDVSLDDLVAKKVNAPTLTFAKTPAKGNDCTLSLSADKKTLNFDFDDANCKSLLDPAAGAPTQDVVVKKDDTFARVTLKLSFRTGPAVAAAPPKLITEVPALAGAKLYYVGRESNKPRWKSLDTGAPVPTASDVVTTKDQPASAFINWNENIAPAQVGSVHRASVLPEISFRPSDLANGDAPSIKLPGALVTAAGTVDTAKTCVIDLDDAGQTLQLDFGSVCAELLSDSPKQASVVAKKKDGTVARLNLNPEFPSTGASEKKLTSLPDVNGGVLLYVAWTEKGKQSWKHVAAKAGDLPADLLHVGTTEARAFINWDEKAAKPVAGEFHRVLVGPKKTKNKPGAADFCPTATISEDSKDKYLVCVDLVPPIPRAGLSEPPKPKVRVFPETARHTLAPNQSVRVVVQYEKGGTVAIELGGKEGLFTPSDKDLVNPPSTGPAVQGEKNEDDSTPDIVTVDQEFAPRLPGVANLTIRYKKTEAAAEEVHTVELIVEQTYLGAVRLGLASVWHAVDRGYEARSVNGSKQKEIAATSKQYVDAEFVLGYSPYIGARGYTTACYPHCFEPYVGVGLLAQGSSSALETLKSIHAGLEWEPTPNFAIALTGALRRVNRLADGYKIGAPVGDDVPTQTKIEWGIGLVLNLSPEFFRIAKGASTGFFK